MANIKVKNADAEDKYKKASGAGSDVDPYIEEVDVRYKPNVSGGYDVFRSIDLDESEEEVKGGAGQVFGWYLSNLSTSRLYLKFYNAPAASVTVGTSTPFMTVPLGAGKEANYEVMGGIEFDTGITVAVTTGIADNDTGAPGANEFVANIYYK